MNSLIHLFHQFGKMKSHLLLFAYLLITVLTEASPLPVETLEKKVDALLEANRILLDTAVDYFKRELNNAQHSPRGDEFAGLISTLVKNLAKSAMLLDKTNLGSMSLKEISMEADKLDKFPNETSRVRKFEGIPYELMTTKLGDYKQFAVDSQGGAASLCASSNRTLLMAKSKKVNDFIWNWLSGELHLESRVWLGLAANGTKEKFIWFDGEDATKGYSNWLECDSNSNGNGMLCAQLVVHDSEVRGGMDYDKTCNAKAGQWVASPCKYYDMYLVICQG